MSTGDARAGESTTERNQPMKRTQVDADGTVRCSVCGAKDFTHRNLPLLTRKRLRCRGCGTNLKPGKASASQAREHVGKSK